MTKEGRGESSPDKKILVYGALNIDLVFSVDHIVMPGETMSSTSLTKSAGGKGANQAAALAKAGIPVHIAGKIGADGEFLLNLLESYGVNTEGVARYEGETGQAIIQLDKNRQNAIILHSGGNGAITDDEIHRIIARFHAGDSILLQNEIAGLQHIMESAHRQGMRLCFNPSPCNEAIESLPLDTVDVFFVNELEGATLAHLAPDSSPDATLEALVRRFPRAEIILTAGKDGAYYGYGTTRAHSKAITVPVADTTGAGDTFTGYFLAAQKKNMSIQQSLNIACKAAALAVSRKGAMHSIPFAKEVF